LLDGGESHVRTIASLFEQLGYDVPVFGMVKDEYHKTRAITNGYDEISLSRTDALFVFIYKLQEEVHRSTITKMKNAKRKTLRSSHLTNIKGVGDKKASLIFEKFETLEALKAASVDEIEEVKGINRTTAEAIYEFLHGGGK
jgi:excinuclease ABC subunit C